MRKNAVKREKRNLEEFIKLLAVIWAGCSLKKIGS